MNPSTNDESVRPPIAGDVPLARIIGPCTGQASCMSRWPMAA